MITSAMKRSGALLLVGLLVLTGCASAYVLKLTNGTQITTPSKPRLENGVYYFKDAKGQQQSVLAARVREVAPASVAKAEDKPQPVKMKSDKKRKWYMLWLG